MIDASTIIIGFTGPIGSGCSYVSEMIPKIGLPQKYKYFKVSDVIRDILKSEGIGEPTVKQLQDKGNELRRNNKSNFLIGELLKRIDKQWKPEEDYGIVIDGIKNEGEVTSLKQFPYFFLIAVQALRETRSDRVIKDGRFSSIDEFNNADLRDQSEEYEYGQQVSRCSYLSDIIILNDETIPANAQAEKEKFIRQIYGRYIKLIEDYKEQNKSIDIVPSVDELCMTMAYVLSKSSSCLKRKVGAVIVDIAEAEKNGKDSPGKQYEMPFVVSSGYNEVPIGSYQCVYHPEYGMCYRDYLQEQFTKNLIHCPKCGTKISNIDIECPFCKIKYHEFIKICKKCRKEIDFVFKCSGCGENIFNLFVPGSKESPGRLLDMCRALHAEETALIKLSGNTGKNGNNLVLYVTTQPCNMCANKIVLGGIKTVVFAEPYSMKESNEILSRGKVNTRRFQGVKSSAFFRLYQ